MTKQSEKVNGVWAYFILTYVIMLLTWGLLAVFQIPGASATSTSTKMTAVGLLLFFLGGFSPSIAGIIMTWHVGGRDGLRDLWKRTTQFKLGWKWYFAILLLPLLVLAVRVAVQVLQGKSIVESSLLIRPLNLIGFTISIVVGGAISEEFGWRGFALNRLLDRWNIWVANLILGILWAFWHLPLFFIPGTVQSSRGNTIVEFAIFAVFIMSLTVLFTWLHINTGQSLFAVLLFHTAIDWFGTFTGTIMTGGISDRLVQAIAFAVMSVIILIWWKPNRRLTTA